MNLYLISQNENNNYDTFDSAVVCANDEYEAKTMHPYGIDIKVGTSNWSFYWASSPENVKVKFLGVASDDVEKGVICSSFNAG